MFFQTLFFCAFCALLILESQFLFRLIFLTLKDIILLLGSILFLLPRAQKIGFYLFRGDLGDLKQ